MYFLRFSLNFIAQRTKALALQQESCENYFNPKQSDAKKPASVCCLADVSSTLLHWSGFKRNPIRVAFFLLASEVRPVLLLECT